MRETCAIAYDVCLDEKGEPEGEQDRKGLVAQTSILNIAQELGLKCEWERPGYLNVLIPNARLEEVLSVYSAILGHKIERVYVDTEEQEKIVLKHGHGFVNRVTDEEEPPHDR